MYIEGANMYEGGELTDIITALERGDWDAWEKVRAMDGSAFYVICCCNSERVQRIKVEQTSGQGRGNVQRMDNSEPGQMPVEIALILDACRTNPVLRTQIGAFNRSRFDVVFELRNRGLWDWMVRDS